MIRTTRQLKCACKRKLDWSGGSLADARRRFFGMGAHCGLEGLLTLNRHGGHHHGTTTTAFTAGCVSLAQTVGSHPNRLALFEHQVLGLLLGSQRWQGDWFNVQRATERLLLCFLAESRLSARHRLGVARL